MAESRNVNSGACNKGRTTMKNTDADSPLKLEKQNGRRTQGRNDQSHSDVMENSESRPRRRKSSKSDNNEPVQSRAGPSYNEFEDENFLFELALSPSNFVDGTLTIPWRTAKKHFLFDHKIGTCQEIELEIFDKKYCKQHNMKLSVPSRPGAQLVITGWGKFLGPNENPDLVGFYKPAYPLDKKHYYYLVDFTRESYVFLKKLSRTDATAKLNIPSEAAETKFPPLEDSKAVMQMDCCDAQNNAWKMTYRKSEHKFVISGEWRKFSKHHKLEANDMVIISSADPQQSLRDSKQYLIRVGKGEETATRIDAAEDDRKINGGSNKGISVAGNDNSKPVAKTRGSNVMLFGVEIPKPM